MAQPSNANDKIVDCAECCNDRRSRRGPALLLVLFAAEAAVVQANLHTMKSMSFKPASRGESDSARRSISISVPSYCRLDGLVNAFFQPKR